MATTSTGVYPVSENQFKIGTDSSMKPIADMESFSVSFDNGVEEWTPMEAGGWARRLMTAKSVTISISGKRNVGDEGNDMVANLAFVSGRAAEKDLLWTFPDGTTVLFAGAVISVTECGAGDSTNVAPLAFDVMSNGKPTVTPAV